MIPCPQGACQPLPYKQKTIIFQISFISYYNKVPRIYQSLKEKQPTIGLTAKKVIKLIIRRISVPNLFLNRTSSLPSW